MVLPSGTYQMVIWNETALVGTSDVDLSSASAAAVSL
jgi:hypothetical protein